MYYEFLYTIRFMEKMLKCLDEELETFSSRISPSLNLGYTAKQPTNKLDKEQKTINIIKLAEFLRFIASTRHSNQLFKCLVDGKIVPKSRLQRDSINMQL